MGLGGSGAKAEDEGSLVTGGPGVRRRVPTAAGNTVRADLSALERHVGAQERLREVVTGPVGLGWWLPPGPAPARCGIWPGSRRSLRRCVDAPSGAANPVGYGEQGAAQE